MGENEWVFSDVCCAGFRKCECFVPGILLLNIQHVNMKKWERTALAKRNQESLFP